MTIDLLPKDYEWLAQEPGPKMLVEALKLYGTLETPGHNDNPVILAWAKECGITNYIHDEISWCGLFMAVIAVRAGKKLPWDNPNKALWALNWGAFGYPVLPMNRPSLGDILTFQRFNSTGQLIGGHVALYIGEDADAFHILGGNQSDKVCITRIARSRLHSATEPEYSIRPTNVRRIYLSAKGALSQNEA